ncbi:MAG: serine hydrolase [Nitrospinae bacterium]|nr:serine hydrolase [Nitrospinota bacterium]
MHYKRSGFPIVALVVTFLVHSGCAGNRAPATNVKTYQYTVPEATNDGWDTAHLSSENIDADLIHDLFDRVINKTYKNIHSILLVKNGKLVVEEYFPGRDRKGQYRAFTRDTLHEQYSVTKSVNSILIGIAIDQYLIRGVDEKISAFFPEYSDIFANSEKDKIRLKHFLSMTALSWDEWTYPYTDARNDHVSLDRSNDHVRYALERPVVEAPGTKFVYNSGIAITLGEIVYKVSRLRADKFAERYLFVPLGISDYYWEKYPNGTVQTGGGLYLRPRDMAKIGHLFLNGGRWQGKQIVSEAWVKESTKPQVGAGQLPALAQAQSYGYQWWLGAFRVRDRVVESYSAQGRGGQFIVVFPDLHMVAVFTGWNDKVKLWIQPLEMLQQYILPAVR